MRHVAGSLAVCVLLFVLSTVVAPAQVPGRTITVFQGARLVNSDGSAPIDDSAFIVESGRFARVGRTRRSGRCHRARRVDLDWQDRDSRARRRPRPSRLHEGPDDRPAELHAGEPARSPAAHAYHGVALGSTWGSDFGEMPFHVRDNAVSECGAVCHAWPRHHDAGRRDAREHASGRARVRDARRLPARPFARTPRASSGW